MSFYQMGVLDVITDQWQTMEQLERRLGRPVAGHLPALVEDGKVWRMIDATQEKWVAKYCKPHRVMDQLIGKSHVGRLARPVLEAAE